MSTYILFNIGPYIVRQDQPPLLVLLLQRGVFGGEVVLELQAGGRARHLAVAALCQHLRQHLDERCKIVADCIFQELFC